MLSGGSAVSGVSFDVSIYVLGGGTSNSSSKYPANLCNACGPSRSWPSSDSTMDGIRGCVFPLSSVMALKAGPELHANKCDETRPQTSLTLASCTSHNVLETVCLRDRYSGRSLFSVQSHTAAPTE